MNKSNANVNQNSFLYLFIYGGIIFIIILVGILPLYLKTSANIKENEKLTYQIKEQNDLKPVYSSLLNAMKDKDLLVLPNPEKKPLPRLEAGKFRDDFNAVAKKSGVAIVSFVPDSSTSTGASTSLLHQYCAEGGICRFSKNAYRIGSRSLFG